MNTTSIFFQLVATVLMLFYEIIQLMSFFFC